MVSEHCDLNEFLSTVKNREPNDIILTAIYEVTTIERLFLKNRRSKNFPFQQHQTYAEQLKMLISYLRYGLRSPALSRAPIDVLNRIPRP